MRRRRTGRDSGTNISSRTARWRTGHARSTDKNLQNWQLIGAIRAMLPAARIVDCRRDPLETCWSALRLQFGTALPFTCGIDEIASYWRDYDRLIERCNAIDPGAVFRHDYEALLARSRSAHPRIARFLWPRVR